MNYLANIFSPAPVYTIFSVALAGIIGFIAGYLIKLRVIAKHKKRILHLEDEMLSNHTRILQLEKEIAGLKDEKLKSRSENNEPYKVKFKAL